MDINSPDDCFVSKIFVSTGRVKKGDQLIQLYSPSLTQKLDRINKFIEIIKIKLRQYTSPQIDYSKKSIADIIGFDTDSAAKTQEVVAINEGNFKLGAIDYGQLSDVHVSSNNSNIQLSKDQLTANQFDLKTQDAIDKINTMMDAATKEEEILNDFLQRLLLIAPIDGAITLQCLEGMFYKKGHLLATFL